MTTKQYDLRTRNGGTLWVLLVPKSSGVDTDWLYNLDATNGLPIINDITPMSENPRSLSFQLYPDPRCGDFEAELTAALDAWFKVPLAEREYALVSRAALQDIIDDLRDSDMGESLEQQFVVSAANEVADDLERILNAGKENGNES